MGISQVIYMNIITNTCSIMSIIIITKNRDTFTISNSRIQY